MIVLNARGTVFLGSLASPAIIEMYSGPSMQKPATLTALRKDSRRVEAFVPAQGPGSFQYRKPYLLEEELSGGLPDQSRSHLLMKRIASDHRDERVDDEPRG